MTVVTDPPLWAILLHLSAYAQLGVLTRVYIGKLFGGACSSPGRWHWAPCVTSPGLTRPGGALFTDFPANVVGSFLIGILSSGAVFQSTFPRVGGVGDHAATQLLFLPSSSPLQSHFALHVGLRTGYCGSLTTLSSWITQGKRIREKASGGCGQSVGARALCSAAPHANLLHPRPSPTTSRLNQHRKYRALLACLQSVS